MNTGKLFSFDGRVGRKAYWLIAIIAAVVSSTLVLVTNASDSFLLALIAIVISIPLVIMSLATQVKRWHDHGKSGWWVFFNLVPIVGPIYCLVKLGFLPGTVGENAYGNPEGGSPLA